MSERGLGPLARLITDLPTYLFIYEKLFSGDSAGNTMFSFLKFVQKSSIWQGRPMSKLPFAKDNGDCGRGWAVTFHFFFLCTRVDWTCVACFGLQLSVIASVGRFPISRGLLHILPPFVFHFFPPEETLSLRSLRPSCLIS